jgi:hypothetical protein
VSSWELVLKLAVSLHVGSHFVGLTGGRPPDLSNCAGIRGDMLGIQTQ